ncbi:hypothetical protein TEA_003027 [Camellia sinensis var. sinensis]|uniref:AIR9-like A9 domain-containing protein n=1 Tax=Camellia sinensis var. sinensis TaxID=542762 RepID=A0A4S4D5H2_CAMSN|nr:hypothetical protein TEA_003027 [Camellia sinensis var. sinensis]
MYKSNVDDVGYRLVALYTPVREDGVEGQLDSASTESIAVEPGILKEVKQKLDLGSVKFEVGKPCHDGLVKRILDLHWIRRHRVISYCGLRAQAIKMIERVISYYGLSDKAIKMIEAMLIKVETSYVLPRLLCYYLKELGGPGSHGRQSNGVTYAMMPITYCCYPYWFAAWLSSSIYQRQCSKHDEHEVLPSSGVLENLQCSS